MQAAQINEYGGKDVIRIVETDTPEPKADQVLVAVKAAGMNPFDWKVREGYMKDFIPLELPATLGGDVAGVVAKVGSDVTDFSVGQAVYGSANAVSGNGSYAEFTPVAAKQLVVKPEGVDFITAAALPLAGASAYQAIVDHLNVQSGQKVLVHGGAGGIGSLAVQIVKQRGAYVATTAATGDVDFVRQLGADEVIDYTAEDFAAKLHDYDAVFDTVGDETATKSYGVLKKGGTLVSMVAQADEALAAEQGITFISQSTQPTAQRLQAVIDMVSDGTLKVTVDKVFAFEQVAEALEYLKTGHPRGKVVLSVQN